LHQNLAIALVLMTGITAVAIMTIVRMVFKKDERLAEIRAREATGISPELRETLDSLRREVAQLRDTSTQYDVSFDAALQRLEGRVVHLEQRGTSAAGTGESASVKVGR
jgi:hypothetical protein